jgi:hypothetical protein
LIARADDLREGSRLRKEKDHEEPSPPIQGRSVGEFRGVGGDRVERTTRFTGITVRAFLTIPTAADTEKAGQLLEKAERTCLITNSLVCAVKLEPNVSAE